MNKKIYQIITYVNLFIIISSALLVGYWYFIDGIVRPPLEFYVDNENFTLDKEIYKPGEAVSIETSFCKNYGFESLISWNIVDTIIRTYPVKNAELGIGCYGVPNPVWAHIVSLPPDISEGNYFILGVERVRLNPVKVVEYKYITKQFSVHE